jgi:hypothetical protein
MLVLKYTVLRPGWYWAVNQMDISLPISVGFETMSVVS